MYIQGISLHSDAPKYSLTVKTRRKRIPIIRRAKAEMTTTKLWCKFRETSNLHFTGSGEFTSTLSLAQKTEVPLCLYNKEPSQPDTRGFQLAWAPGHGSWNHNWHCNGSNCIHWQFSMEAILSNHLLALKGHFTQSSEVFLCCLIQSMLHLTLMTSFTIGSCCR